MPRYSRASPVCAYFDRHLVQVLKALPPLITWSQCHFTDNFTSRRMCQGKRAIRAPGNAEKQLVFSFWKASKGMQSTVRSKAFDERWRTKDCMPLLAFQNENTSCFSA